MVLELKRLLEQIPPNQTVSALPANHDINMIIQQILIISTQATDQEGTMLEFSQKVVQPLFKTTTQLGCEVYVILLDQLGESSSQVIKEAIEWLVYTEDKVWWWYLFVYPSLTTFFQWKLNMPVISILLCTNLVLIAE